MKISRTRRKQIASSVLDGRAEVKEAARRAAYEMNIAFGELWQWVLDEARSRACALIPSPFPIGDLRDDGRRMHLLSEIRRDETFTSLNRFLEVIAKTDADEPTLVEVLRRLPEDGSQDIEFSSVVAECSLPEDLLLDLVDQGRFLTDIAHRRGPRRVLEEVARRCPSLDEAVVTLFTEYYVDESVSLGDFEALLERYRDIASLSESVLPVLHGRKREAALRILRGGGSAQSST